MADLVNIQLNTKWVTFGVRVTTLHVILGGAIAGGVLYLVQELERIERSKPVEAGDQPTPITRGGVTSAS